MKDTCDQNFVDCVAPNLVEIVEQFGEIFLFLLFFPFPSLDAAVH